ncbi:Retrovirus-related Pol polyprotein from transposon TNT 1-94 [Gossypium australe]|uniref:Retrovirus-related Pol polyprotein from transposon TNT 1-94 n=1 Tax=Gossypium australe TaxID=47621 RepID=A0A5B6W8J2_9ROSI|nr:Retrovirus-related Pol polyprotein from transposon TNT 1-94 [Gossypium australe]
MGVHANKVCRHTIISTISNELFDIYCSYNAIKEFTLPKILVNKRFSFENTIDGRCLITKACRYKSMITTSFNGQETATIMLRLHITTQAQTKETFSNGPNHPYNP